MCEKTLSELLESLDTIGCGECCDHPHYENYSDEEIENMEKPKKKKLDPIVPEYELTADEARELGKPKVKLINVNKTVSKLLTYVYNDIAEFAEEGVLEYNLLADFPEELEGVRSVTMVKVIERMAKHLSDNGFDTDITINDIKEPRDYILLIEW